MNSILAAVVWEPIIPLPMIILLWVFLAGLAWWAMARGGPRLGWAKRLTLLLLRWFALTMLVLPLLQPSREEALPRSHPARLALVALDTSRSMAEVDESASSRLDAGRRMIRQHKLVGESPLGNIHLHAFDTESRPVTTEDFNALQANGDSSFFNTSLSGILRTLGTKENCVGLFLFTDGHDFEGVPPERLGKLARQYRTPIYPVPLGKTVHLPDVAVFMVSTQPSTFVKQRSRLDAAVRFRSCGARQVRMELVRAGEVVREQKIRSTGDDEVPVSFEVSEEKPGQYEYEIRCTAQPDERDLENNTAYAYLNVTDARIPVLLLEGEPHWDSSFLQRTLSRNNRISLDTVVSSGKSRKHNSRSDTTLPKLADLSATLLASYPVIILGRQIERVLSEEMIADLVKNVTDRGLTLIFARGAPGTSAVWAELSPSEPGAGHMGPVSLVPSRSKGSVVPLEVLLEGGPGKLPALPVAAGTGKPKLLASVEAKVQDDMQKQELPAMLLRQQGSGQVFEMALEGVWKWALHASAEADNNVYDRFWNQLLINLVARSNRTPSDQPQLIVPKANLEVGEEVHFILQLPASPDGTSLQFTQPPTLQLSKDGSNLATAVMSQRDPSGPWEGTATADKTGRYRAELTLPDGVKIGCRYGVYAPQTETTDVATDLEYLRKLATASGGRVLDAASLPGVLETLSRAAAAESAAPPAVRRISLWDTTLAFWLLCAAFGIDWFLRRRWGMV